MSQLKLVHLALKFLPRAKEGFWGWGEWYPESFNIYRIYIPSKTSTQIIYVKFPKTKSREATTNLSLQPSER